MTDKELIKFATQFAKGIIGKDEPEGYCYMVCLPLVSFLYYCDITDIQLVCGEIKDDTGDTFEHFWIELKDGRILDPTASQFIAPDGKRMPKTYLGAKPDWYTVIPNKISA